MCVCECVCVCVGGGVTGIILRSIDLEIAKL